MPVARCLILGGAAVIVLPACSIPRPVDAIVDAGDRAERQGDLALAEQEYLAAVEKRPGNVNARMALGDLYLATDRPELAVAQYEVVRTIRPTDDEIIDKLAQAMLESGDTGALTVLVTERAKDRATPTEWVRAGDWLAQAGDADAALIAYRTAARMDAGQSASIQKRLAEFHQSLGDQSAALRRYRMALYLDPADEETRAAIRALGEIPGPTLALPPAELGAAPTP